MSVGMLASTDGVVGIQGGTEQRNRFINRSGATVAVGESMVLDIQMSATETVNWLQGDEGSVWVNTIRPRNQVDFDDKPYLIVVDASVEDDEVYTGALWSFDLPVRVECVAASPAPDPLTAGHPICAPAVSSGGGNQYANRDMSAQHAGVSWDDPAYAALQAALPPVACRDRGAKYTGRLWESAAHGTTANRRCLWNGWTGFGIVSHANP